jgi:hypothetical protein
MLALGIRAPLDRELGAAPFLDLEASGPKDR